MHQQLCTVSVVFLSGIYGRLLLQLEQQRHPASHWQKTTMRWDRHILSKYILDVTTEPGYEGSAQFSWKAEEETEGKVSSSGTVPAECRHGVS